MIINFDKIKKQITTNPILLYMKGSPKIPSCGFSAKAVKILYSCGERFAYIDVLINPEIRSQIVQFSNWPTFPQLWVNAELIGGCDIIVEMHHNNELLPLLKQVSKNN